MCFTRHCNLASVVTLPGQWHRLVLVLVSEWLPTASCCERAVKMLFLLCRSSYYDIEWTRLQIIMGPLIIRLSN